MKLYLENVRSFEGWHEIPITPATVLVGENSAGKSTLLGMLAVVHQNGFPSNGNFFNQFPFELGGYKTLATNKKYVHHFSVGFETTARNVFSKKEHNESTNAGLVAAFRENAGLPVLCHVFAWVGEVALELYEEGFEAVARNEQIKLPKNIKIKTIVSKETNQQGLSLQSLWRTLRDQVSSDEKNEANQELDFLFHSLGSGFITWHSSAMAFAPMRSRPKRTYDQLSDEFSSEGEHVPLLLARATDPNNKQALALHEGLQAFGNYSEMFTDIGVKQLGKGSGDPFQVQVQIGKHKPNIMDVGYGVSQVLPLLVDAQRASPRTVLLLQQPEVHLHPKAQAALGSMIKDWVSKNKKTVVVETHSDYLVDRLRLEVKQKKLKHNEISIFFLDKKGTQTVLHLLNIDDQGNILNAPEGYRDFFLREQIALLMD